MKVCMVVPHFFPHVGGGEQLYYDIAKGIQEQGYEVRIVTSSSAGICGNKSYEGLDCYYCDWKIVFGHPIVKRKDIVPHIQWADIVHTTIFTTAIKSRKVSKRYKKPCVITIHEVIGKKWFWIVPSKIKASMFLMYERLICKQPFDAYHVVSEATKNDYISSIKRKDNIFRIYNSIELPDKSLIDKEEINYIEYFDLKKSDKTFLYFGRPAQNKGIFVLEEAIHILKEKNKIPENVKFCWLLAEDPAPQRAKLLKLIQKHGTTQCMRIRKPVKRTELFKIISSVDYVIIPSITEGFGFSAVEACSLKKKVICSNGGSLPEVIFGQCLMYENRNAEDLANKIERALNSDDAFQEIPEKRFEKDRMVKEIMQMYESLKFIECKKEKRC